MLSLRSPPIVVGLRHSAAEQSRYRRGCYEKTVVKRGQAL